MTTATATRRRQVRLVRLVERSRQGGGHLVDRDAGIIHGVSVMGHGGISDNGRRYSPEALADLVRLAEGAKVHWNHPRRPTDMRDSDDLIGWLENVRRTPDGNVVADLHYLREHPKARRLAEAAERCPDLEWGLSINADGEMGGRDGRGREVVKRLHELRGADVVTSPATNRNLFESDRRRGTMRYTEQDSYGVGTPGNGNGGGGGGSWKECLRDAIRELANGDEADHDRARQLMELLADAAGGGDEVEEEGDIDSANQAGADMPMREQGDAGYALPERTGRGRGAANDRLESRQRRRGARSNSRALTERRLAADVDRFVEAITGGPARPLSRFGL
jgi:hypothetical protein